MLIIGHRGAAGLELENSISSILKGIEVGVDWIEIDVWKTLDNEIIVFHDAYIDRLTNQKGIVREMNYHILKDILLKNGEYIPTLKDIAKIAKQNNINLLVELKSEEALEQSILILESELPYSQFIIGSFFHKPIKEIKEKNPLVQTSIMFEGVPVDLMKYLKFVNPDFITISIETYDNYLLEVINNLNKKLIFYTVNTDSEMELAIQANPFGIITNYPDKFISL